MRKKKIRKLFYSVNQQRNDLDPDQDLDPDLFFSSTDPGSGSASKLNGF